MRPEYSSPFSLKCHGGAHITRDWLGKGAIWEEDCSPCAQDGSAVPRAGKKGRLLKDNEGGRQVEE